MIDDRKHSEAMKLWLTEREIVDLMRCAAAEDRKPGEMARVMVRQYMYGIVGRRDGESNEANRGDAGRGA
ncbi:MAG: hypothetical protein KA778_14810 [Burkholderiaceae bacterium]|nr:hypothetical protein [Burkholderiaceae bacterium]